ncbi:CCDC90 family protein [Candidatus Binatia bacterium]|jgi:hypothetical protein|nr:CCDC90 family protein [Candidatus Binatia bacterium]
MVTFDTLAYAKRLRSAGLSEEQADVHAEALASALGEVLVTKQDLRDLATKADVHRLELATKEDFASVRQEMSSEFAAVRQEMGSEFAAVRQEMRALELRMTLRVGALFSIGIGALAALIKLG